MDNNIPENQNNEQVEEFSTVFSNPTEHKKVSTAKKGKRLKIVISSILAVAILLGGTFAVVKLVPEKEDPTQNPVDNKIEVVNYTSDKIKEITIKNKNGSFSFYSETVMEKVSEDTEASEVEYWYVKGYKKEFTDSDIINQIVSSAIDFTAIREITTKSPKECGLESPQIMVDITTTDKKKTSYYIGKKSPDNAGFYVKLTEKDTVYLVAQDFEQSLLFEDLDLASTVAQGAITLDDKYDDYYEGGKLSKADEITVSGVNFPQKVIFVPNKDNLTSDFVHYVISSPVKRSALNTETLFNVFSQGFNVAGAYSYDVSQKTLNKLGLNKPDFVLSARFDDFTYTYKFKQQKDGDYAVVGTDSKNVKKVTLSDCAFLTSKTTDYYNGVLMLVSIDKVKNLIFEVDGKKYDFSIKPNPEDDPNNKFIIECDGKKYNSSYFQSLYQYLCMLQASDFTVDKLNEKPEIVLTYKYNDKKSKDTRIEFVKVNATKYQYSINGEILGKINSSSVKKITTNLQRLLDGKSITVN